MDLSFCLLDSSTSTLKYSGANNPIYLVRKDTQPGPEVEKMKVISENGYTLYDIQPDKQPIGIFPKEKPFQEQSIPLLNGDKLYLFTDGYYDQIGGEEGRKLMSKNFKRLLLDMADKSPEEQKHSLEIKLRKWKKYRYKQVDDILVMGVLVS